MFDAMHALSKHALSLDHTGLRIDYFRSALIAVFPAFHIAITTG